MGDFTNEWSGGFHPRKKKKKNNTVLMFDENARRSDNCLIPILTVEVYWQ